MRQLRFPNQEQECFGSCLANYFDLIEEYELAESVYQNFRRHPLVRSDGAMLPSLSSRLVRDLTDNRYRGKYSYIPIENNLGEIVEQVLGVKKTEALQAIKQEIESGNAFETAKIEYNRPALVLHYFSKINFCHWIVDVGHDWVIDDGLWQKVINLPKFQSFVKGVMTIEKV